jgi:hypothetical protein
MDEVRNAISPEADCLFFPDMFFDSTIERRVAQIIFIAHQK